LEESESIINATLIACEEETTLACRIVGKFAPIRDAIPDDTGVYGEPKGWIARIHFANMGGQRTYVIARELEIVAGFRIGLRVFVGKQDDRCTCWTISVDHLSVKIGMLKQLDTYHFSNVPSTLEFSIVGSD
jgi:hypothetical protein